MADETALRPTGSSPVFGDDQHTAAAPAAGIDLALQRFAEARGRPTAVYLLAPNEPIGLPNVWEVASCMGDREFEKLDLLIQSSGGDIHAAYQLLSFLRSRSEHLSACVPRYARSAATLLCIGADEIVLDDLAALGPLDAQVYEGMDEQRRARYASALSASKTVDLVRDTSLEALRAAAAMLYDSGIAAGVNELMKFAVDFLRATTAPMFEKIEVTRMSEYLQALAIGEEYGNRVLRSAGMSDDERQRIVTKLVYGYPSHEYIIDHYELRDLGLHVRLFDGDESVAARALAKYAHERAVLIVDPP